ARQDDAPGAVAIDRWVVDPRGHRRAVAESSRGVDHTAARANDHRVRAPEVLLGPVVDRPHALGHRLILLMDAGDAGEALGLLRLAVDQIVVVLVLRQTELAVPVGRVR